MDVWRTHYYNYSLEVTSPEFIILKCAVGVLAELIRKDPAMITGDPKTTKFAEVAARMFTQMEDASSVNQHLPVQDQTVQASGEGSQVRVSTMEPGGGCCLSIRSAYGED